MCRMIAATGQVNIQSLRENLTMMANNENPGYTHEKRKLGAKFRHEDGWGAGWLENGALRVRKSPRSILRDGSVAELDSVQTDLIVLHARRASNPRSARLENTHPFVARMGGQTWAFCHNGAVEEISALTPPRGLTPRGGTDSEKLFYHLLVHLDESDMAEAVAAAFAPIRDYTALLCFLANSSRIYAMARCHPEKGSPGYHSLWHGRGENLQVVSSEPLEGIGCSDWQRIPELGVVTLERTPSA
jgi:predicted glutamine amidotransferase